MRWLWRIWQHLDIGTVQDSYMSAPRNLWVCLPPDYINHLFLISWRQFLEISHLSEDEGQYSKCCWVLFGLVVFFSFFWCFLFLFLFYFFLLSETCKQMGAFINLEILMQKVIKTLAEKNPAWTQCCLCTMFPKCTIRTSNFVKVWSN